MQNCTSLFNRMKSCIDFIWLRFFHLIVHASESGAGSSALLWGISRKNPPSHHDWATHFDNHHHHHHQLKNTFWPWWTDISCGLGDRGEDSRLPPWSNRSSSDSELTLVAQHLLMNRSSDDWMIRWSDMTKVIPGSIWDGAALVDERMIGNDQGRGRWTRNVITCWSSLELPS